MRQRALLICVVFLAMMARARAQEGELRVTLQLTYTSKWLSKGVEAYGDKGALFKTVDLDFCGTGLGVKVTHRNATSGGYVGPESFDYRPYYKGELIEDAPYAMSYNLSVGCEHYPPGGLERSPYHVGVDSCIFLAESYAPRLHSPVHCPL